MFKELCTLQQAVQFWFCSVLIWLHQERESRTSFKQQVSSFNAYIKLVVSFLTLCVLHRVIRTTTIKHISGVLTLTEQQIIIDGRQGGGGGFTQKPKPDKKLHLPTSQWLDSHSTGKPQVLCSASMYVVLLGRQAFDCVHYISFKFSS